MRLITGDETGLLKVRTRVRANQIHDLLRMSAQVVRVEGVLALWKGLLPVYCRQAPFNLFNFISYFF